MTRPATREQRCWFHKQANVLAALPKSAHPGALTAIKDIYNAEDIDRAQLAIKAFEVDYGAKYPKAVAKIVDDTDVLLEFYNYPAEHWIHLRTTNPIESTFATVRLRTKVTKGPGSRAAGIAMAYKLIDAAQARWRAVNAPHLVALVRAGAMFHKGKLLERPVDIAPAHPSTAVPQSAGSEVAENRRKRLACGPSECIEYGDGVEVIAPVHDLPVAQGDHRNEPVGVGAVSVDGMAFGGIFEDGDTLGGVVIDGQIEAALQLDRRPIRAVELSECLSALDA